MTLELHAEASRELAEAVEWYEARQPGLGAELLREVDRAFGVIVQSPRMWPLWPGWHSRIRVRRFLLLRFPFSIAFLIVRRRVIVLAIAHVRRRPYYWRERIPL